MAILSTISIENLLKPVSLRQLTGKDLRLDDSPTSLYQRLKSARNEARAIERQQLQSGELIGKVNNWQVVMELGQEILIAHSKDLEVVVWLIEALLREQGFTGLRDGFYLANELIKQYWDTLYPIPDEDGLLTKLAALTGLNGEEADGTLIVPIRMMPLTEGSSAGPFALWQYQQAVELLKIAESDKREQRIKSGAVTLEQIEKAVLETAPEFFTALLKSLQAAIEAFSQLTALLAEKCGHDAPPSSRILSELRACVDCVNTIAKVSLEKNQISVSKNLVSAENIQANLALPSSEQLITINTHVNKSRDEILQSLLQAAEFFRLTEPHSPIPYVLERTVRWGRMPLPELLRELIKDEQALGQLCSLTGIAVS